MKAALYIRSSAPESPNQDWEAQLASLRTFAETSGWQVAREYIDYFGLSPRPLDAWGKMLTELPKRRFDVIAVARLNVAFRSANHMHETLRTFSAFRINFLSLEEEFDTRSPVSIHTLRVLASVAGFESETRRQRIRAGITSARLRGAQIGRPPITNRPEIRAMWPSVEARIRHGELSVAEAARILGIGKTTVSRLLRQARAADADSTASLLDPPADEDALHIPDELPTPRG